MGLKSLKSEEQLALGPERKGEGMRFRQQGAMTRSDGKAQLYSSQFWTSLSRDLSLAISLFASAELKWIRDFNFMV